MASWTGFLLLTVISVTLLDLTEGLTCYDCWEQRFLYGPRPLGRSSSSEEEPICYGPNPNKWPTKDNCSLCATSRFTACGNDGQFKDYTYRDCSTDKTIDGFKKMTNSEATLGCEHEGDVTSTRVKELGDKNSIIWAKLCLCNDKDKCNTVYIPSPDGKKKFDCQKAHMNDPKEEDSTDENSGSGSGGSVSKPGALWGMIQLGLGAVGVVRAALSGF